VIETSVFLFSSLCHHLSLKSPEFICYFTVWSKSLTRHLQIYGCLWQLQSSLSSWLAAVS